MIEIGNIKSTSPHNILDIKNTSNVVKVRYAIGEKDVLFHSLMGEHYIEVSFFLNSRKKFVRGDYIEYNGEKFTLREYIKVEQVNKVKYQYTLRFEAIECFFNDIQMFYLNQKKKESHWQLTSTASTFLQIVVDNINRYFKTNTFIVGTVECLEIKNIQFEANTSVFSALNKIAETFSCEWQIAGGTINFVKVLSFGSSLNFELDKSLSEVKIEANSNNEKKYNRIIALGSERNIPRNYRGVTSGEAVDAIYQKRLRIPIDKGDYITTSEDLTAGEVVEGVIVFDDIYPRRVGTVEAISTVSYTDVDKEKGTTTNWNAYKIKDLGITFKEDYLLPGQELRILFQSGALSGRDFAVFFHKDGFTSSDNSQCYELKREDDNGYNIPNEILKPAVGDKYVLHGFNISLVSEQYVQQAERELYEEATKWLQKQKEDTNVYECTTSIGYFSTNKLDLEVGQAVNLQSDLFATGYKKTRIISFEKKLYNRYNATYRIGDKAPYTKFEKIEKEIKELKTVEATNLNNGNKSSSIYLIKQHDNTLASDFNAYSAKATERKFLSKTINNEITEEVNFTRGLTTLNAIIKELATTKKLSVDDVANIAKLVISGELKSKDYSSTDGFKIFRGENGWNIEIDNIIARKTFKTLEIVVQRVVHQGGMIIQSPAGGELIKRHSETAEYWGFWVSSEDGFRIDDLVLCQTFKGGDTKRYWRCVDSYDPANKIVFIRKNDSEVGSDIPEVGDVIVVLGNKSDARRQNARVISVIGDNAPYTADYKGINDYTLQGKLITQIGNLTGVNDPAFGGNLSGVGAYFGNAYIKGQMVVSSGERVEEFVRGKADTAKSQAITASQQALNTAKSELKADATSKADSAKSQAISASQQALNTAKSELKADATSKADSAKSQAISASQQALNTAKSELKADATSKADTAKSQAISASQQALNSAKSELKADATSKADSAKSQAISASQQALNTAKSELKADATSKADSAKSQAITASQQALNSAKTELKADASTKAEQAKQGAIQQANNAVERAKTELKAEISEAEKKAELAKMTAGRMLYKDPTFTKGMNRVLVYNNEDNDNVRVERVARSADNPTSSSYELKITTVGVAAPNHGGFSFGNKSRANAVFYLRFLAKIPEGVSVKFKTGKTGDGAKYIWLTPYVGTGRWEEYAHKVVCGNVGLFKWTNFICTESSNTATPDNPVEWRVAYATVYDATEAEIDYMAEVEQRYVTKSVHSSAVQVLDDKISQKVNRTDFDQHNVKLAEHTSTIQQLATSISQTVKKTDFDDLGRRVGTTESLIRQSAGRIDLLVTKTNEQADKIEDVESSVENAKTELKADASTKAEQAKQGAIQQANNAVAQAKTELKADATSKADTAKSQAISELGKAKKALEDSVSALRGDLGATRDEVLVEADRRLKTAKEQVQAQVKEDVKAGITADEDGNITVLGKQIALIGTTLAEKIVVQGLTAKIAELAQLISDNITTKKIEVRVGNKEVALIDAPNGIARFGDNTKIGNFYIQGSNIMSLNKSSKIELDYSSQGKVAHISTEDDAALWGQNNNGVGVLAASKNHTYKSSSNSTRVAIMGKGGTSFNTSQHDYWRMPGLLWCGRVNKWGTITHQWGDGVSNVSVSKIGVGFYRVSFSNSDVPQIYVPQITPHTNEYWSSAWVHYLGDNNFSYETVDTGQGKRDIGVMIAIFGVSRIK